MYECAYAAGTTPFGGRERSPSSAPAWDAIETRRPDAGSGTASVDGRATGSGRRGMPPAGQS